MGRIKDLLLDYQTQRSRDELDEAVKWANEKGNTTVHVGSQFIPLDKALSIQELLKNQPIENE